MYILARWVLYSLLIMFIAWIIPGITITGFVSALIAMLIFGLVNALIKPLLYVITLPINILTLGIFSFVLNALLFMLVGYITPGFQVANFLSALLGSIILSVVGAAINRLDRQTV